MYLFLFIFHYITSHNRKLIYCIARHRGRGGGHRAPYPTPPVTPIAQSQVRICIRIYRGTAYTSMCLTLQPFTTYL